MAVDQTPIQAIYDRLNQAMSFHPGSTEIFDDFLQEAGDVVTMISDNVNFDFPIFSQHMKWNGSMLTTLESTGNEIRNELPPLQRRSKNGSYGAGQRITEQGVIYQTEITKTNKVVGMGASAIGVKLDANGNPMIDPNNPNEFIWDDTNPNGAKVFSKLTLTPNRAQLLAGINGNASENTMIKGAIVDLSAQGTVLIQAINAQDPTQTSIRLQAAQINLDGYVTASYIDAEKAVVDQLITSEGYTGTIYANGLSATTGEITALTAGNFYLRNNPSSTSLVTRKGVKIANGAVSQTLFLLGTGTDSNLEIPNAVTHFGNSSSSSGTISIPYYTLASGGGTPAGNITFNIADTAYYQSHIGISTTGSWQWDAEAGSGDGAYVRTIVPNAGNSETIDFPAVTATPGITYNSTTHVYTATAVAEYSGRDVSSVSSTASGVEAYEDGWDGCFNTKSFTGDASATLTYGQSVSVSASLTNSSGVVVSLGNRTYTAPPDNGGVSALGLSSAYDTQPSADEYKGELTANKYYKVTAVPVSGTGKSFSFKTPAGGGSGGISNMTVGSGSTSEPTADYGGSTLTCNRWFVVTATPTSGQSATFKFKTGSPVIDINPQEWRDSGQAAPSGAGDATALNITGSYIKKGKLGTCYFYVTAGASHKWYKIPVDTR